MLSKIGRVATAAAVRAPTRSVFTAASVARRPAAVSNGKSLHWLLLGAGLLMGGLVLAEGSVSKAAMCDAAPQQQVQAEVPDAIRSKPATATASGPSAADLFSPPAPAHDRWDENWDGLARVPPTLNSKGRVELVTRHLLFVRHGQYVHPTAATQHLDPVLTELGHEQAKLTGERLASLGLDVSVIHVSNMARVRQTAEEISAFFPGVPLRENPDLAEGVPSAHAPLHPTWRPDAESLREDPPRIRRAFEQLVHRWRDFEGMPIRSQSEWDAVRVARLKQDPNTLRGDEGSSGQQITSAQQAAKQARETAEQQQHGGKPNTLVSTSAGTIDISGAGGAQPSGSGSSSVPTGPPVHVDRYELVVCHGNVIRYSLLRALQLPVQAWLRLAIYNTGVSHISIRPNGHVTLQSIGDTGHLPKDMITYS